MIVCPSCKNVNSPKRVLATHTTKHGTVKRKRKCMKCKQIFKTIEKPIIENFFELGEDKNSVLTTGLT